MVLVLVLVVVALLTLSCFTFSQLMMAERKAVDLAARQAQARAFADSGIEMVRCFVLKDEETQEQYGGWYSNESGFRGVLVVGEDDGTSTDVGRFSVVAPLVENGYSSGIRFGLEDESARLNLRVVAKLAEQDNDAARDMLMGLPSMTESIADAILDWLDADGEPRELGAESEYYAALQAPYEPRNGPLQTVEELLLVRGITPWLLFGSDANRNGLVDAGETDISGLQGIDNSQGEMSRGWAAYLTLYSKETNQTQDGEAKIDLNQDDLEALYDALETAIGAEQALFIVAYRQGTIYTGEEEGEILSSGDIDFEQEAQTTLASILDLIGTKVTITFEGDDDETILASPFPDMPGMMSSFLPLLMDHCTINTGETISGRININLAPRAVLAGIPGMTEAMLDEIIGNRIMDPQDADESLRYATWILEDGIVTLDEMKKMEPFLTARGSVYRAQVIGYSDRGGPSVRIEAIIDASESPASLRFYRDLTHLGRGFSLEFLGTSAATFK